MLCLATPGFNTCTGRGLGRSHRIGRFNVFSACVYVSALSSHTWFSIDLGRSHKIGTSTCAQSYLGSSDIWALE